VTRRQRPAASVAHRGREVPVPASIRGDRDAIRKYLRFRDRHPVEARQFDRLPAGRRSEIATRWTQPEPARGVGAQVEAADAQRRAARRVRDAARRGRRVSEIQALRDVVEEKISRLLGFAERPFDRGVHEPVTRRGYRRRHVDRMSQETLRELAASTLTADQWRNEASVQTDGNPYWYH
jgi:hypothetical protein